MSHFERHTGSPYVTASKESAYVPRISMMPAMAESQKRLEKAEDPEDVKGQTDFLNQLVAHSPKRFALVEKLEPRISQTFAKLQRDYKGMTGRNEEFTLHILYTGEPNAFILPAAGAIVLDICLLEEMAQSATDNSGNMNINRFLATVRYVLGHEMGHRFHGTFRKELRDKMNQKRKRGDLRKQTGFMEIVEMVEARSYNVTAEQKCDDFSLDLAVFGRENTGEMGVAFNVLRSLQRKAFSNQRAKRRRVRYDTVNLEAESDAMDHLEADSVDEEWEKEEFEHYEAERQRRIDIGIRRMPTIASTHPELGWRRKMFEKKRLEIEDEPERSAPESIPSPLATAEEPKNTAALRIRLPDPLKEKDWRRSNLSYASVPIMAQVLNAPYNEYLGKKQIFNPMNETTWGKKSQLRPDDHSCKREMVEIAREVAETPEDCYILPAFLRLWENNRQLREVFSMAYAAVNLQCLLGSYMVEKEEDVKKRLPEEANMKPGQIKRFMRLMGKGMLLQEIGSCLKEPWFLAAVSCAVSSVLEVQKDGSTIIIERLRDHAKKELLTANALNFLMEHPHFAVEMDACSGELCGSFLDSLKTEQRDARNKKGRMAPPNIAEMEMLVEIPGQLAILTLTERIISGAREAFRVPADTTAEAFIPGGEDLLGVVELNTESIARMKGFIRMKTRDPLNFPQVAHLFPEHLQGLYPEEAMEGVDPFEYGVAEMMQKAYQLFISGEVTHGLTEGIRHSKTPFNDLYALMEGLRSKAKWLCGLMDLQTLFEAAEEGSNSGPDEVVKEVPRFFELKKKMGSIAEAQDWNPFSPSKIGTYYFRPKSRNARCMGEAFATLCSFLSDIPEPGLGRTTEVELVLYWMENNKLFSAGRYGSIRFKEDLIESLFVSANARGRQILVDMVMNPDAVRGWQLRNSELVKNSFQ